MILVQKTKQYKDKLNHALHNFEVPSIGQMGEISARSWNNLTQKLFIADYKAEGVEFKDYLEGIENGKFDRKFLLGIADKEQGFLIVDPTVKPGLICIGGQGSGKSTTLKGILVTLMAASSKNVFLNLVDVSNKGMGDFSSLFQYENVATTLFDTKKLIPSISMAYNELEKRGAAFRAIGSFDNWLAKKNKSDVLPEAKPADGLYDYEAKYKIIWNEYKEMWKKVFSKQDLSQGELYRLEWIADKDIFQRKNSFCETVLKIVNNEASEDEIKQVELKGEPKDLALYVLAFEEFHTICTSPEVNFSENHQTPGTIANQLKLIARTGRASGICICISTQRATYTEIPNDLKAGITNVLAHKLGSSGDAAAFGLDHAQNILSSQRGRAAYEEGFTQFPYFPPSAMDKVVRDNYKEFDALLMGDQVEDYAKILSGEGSDGIVANSKLSFLIANYSMFDKKVLTKRVLEEFDFNFLNEEYPSMELDGVVEKDGKRYSLVVIAPTSGRGMRMGSSISDKKVANLKKEMEATNTESVLVVSFDSISSPLSRLSKETGGYAVDKEDLTKIANILDNKEETIENGTFDTLYKEIPFVISKEDKSNQDEDEDSNDLLDEDEDFLNKFSL